MRRRLCEAAPVIYYGAVEALAGCLGRGMLYRDGMWWAADAMERTWEAYLEML